MMDKIQAAVNLVLLLFAVIAHIIWLKALADYDKQEDREEVIDWP